jgi:hypothetical protein
MSFSVGGKFLSQEEADFWEEDGRLIIFFRIEMYLNEGFLARVC